MNNKIKMLAERYAKCINECNSDSDLKICANFIFREETSFFLENKIYAHELFNYIYDERQKRLKEEKQKERINKVNYWFANVKA